MKLLFHFESWPNKWIVEPWLIFFESLVPVGEGDYITKIQKLEGLHENTNSVQFFGWK